MQNGERMPEYHLCYQSLGKLSDNKDNAILICHSLSGDAHVAGEEPETGRSGWWESYVGPSKAIDTDHFFVIASNVLGGCGGSSGPSSICPSTKRSYAMSFPSVTIHDMIQAQIALIDELGIEKLLAVIGASMGGMQAMLLAVKYPKRVKNCIPIASSMAHSAMQIGFNEVGRQAIRSDPKWNHGNYYNSEPPEHGLAVARMIGHVTYLSEYSMHKKFGRKQETRKSPQSGSPVFFSVESYLQHQGSSFVRRFDPNSYLYITKALDMFDLLAGRPSREVFQNVESQFLIISFHSDWLYPPPQSKELVRALKRSNCIVSYINLSTLHGHDSFLIPDPEFASILQNFLYQCLQKTRLV